MMPFRLLLFFVVLAGYAPYATAQVYEPGLLVRSNGDTLRGEIENGFWKEPPTFIRFRPAPDSPSQLFQPRQLRAVSLTGGRYFRYEALPIDHAAETRPSFLVVGYLPNVQVDSLLAEVVVEGPVSLVRVALPGSVHYLLLRPGQPALDLSERKYLRESERGAHIIVNGNNYHGQLGVYFGTCPAAVAAAQTAPFTASGLAAVVQAFLAACTPAQRPGRSWLTTSRAARRILMQGGLVAGVRYSSIASQKNFDEYVFLDNRLRPMAGLFGEVFFSGNTVSTYAELSLSRIHSRQVYDNHSVLGPNGIISYYSYADYTAWLNTTRIGMRWYAPLRRDQQLVLGLSYELNMAFRPEFSTITNGSSKSPATTLPAQANFTTNLSVVHQTILPSLTIGWRMKQLTLTLNGQRCPDVRNPMGSFVEHLTGSAWAARFTTSYRLVTTRASQSGRR